MALENQAALIKQVDKLAAELDQRTNLYHRLETYYDGESPMPVAVRDAKVTQAYRRLMPVADAPWGSLVVGSVLDRLEIGGIKDENTQAAKAVWNMWQANYMDSESKLAHTTGLIGGRVSALVWPDEDGRPEISLDPPDQMIVQYAEGQRHKRVAALRRWKDADTDLQMATLYLPDGIYKFQEPAKGQPARGAAANWEQRFVKDEDWPVKNPWNTVPVVEVRFNPRLKAGVFAHTRGEYEHCLGMIDRINLLTFLGLVVAFWQGFPLRVLIGERILRDDDNNVIPPFKVGADTIAQLENPNAKLDTYTAADRGNLSIYPELSQLAAITKTPRHYFPLAQAMANLSADAIRADEGALNAKVTAHKGFAGEDWEDVLRLVGLQLGQELSPTAELAWLDHESRSLAERADAAAKLKDLMPWQWVAEHVLNVTQVELAQLEAMKAGDIISQLMTAASQPPASNAGGLSLNGNVAPVPPPAESATPAPTG